MSDTGSSDDDSSRPPRTIVLCFDGTDGQYDSMNTNVVKLFGLLSKGSPEKQVAYYQPGIGTYFAPGVISPLWTRLASLLDEAIAWYLDTHVMDGYKFIMDNYRAGDKICLFGFSRGAYTARALAGMLDKVGLLPKDNLQQVDFAYKAYVRTDKEGVKLAAGFKKTFSRNVKVEFVGVWDTVQSTGVLVSRALPFTASNTAIKVFRHALSLDEHRSRFRPNLYHWTTKDNEPDEVETSWMCCAIDSTLKRLFNRNTEPPQNVGYGTFARGTQCNESDDEATSDVAQPKMGVFAEEESSPTDMLEVWFAGCHCDVGGGNVEDDVEVSLAQIPFRWMVEQVMQSQCGILFDVNELARIGFTVPSLGTAAQGSQSKPHRTSSDPIDRAAIAPLYDELKINKLWWILEVLPSSNAWQDDNGLWHSKWSINLGKGRFIPFSKPKFHHTVKQRMEYGPLKYRPRAVFDHDEVYV